MTAAAFPVWLVMFSVLFVLAFFVFVVGLVAYAIIKNRPAIVAALGGGLLLLMLGGATVGLYAFRSATHVSDAARVSWQVGPTKFETQFASAPTGPTHSSESIRISWVGLLFLVAFPAVLLVSFLRAAA